MKKSLEIFLLVMCFIILFWSVQRSFDIPNIIHHFSISRWETNAVILIVLGIINSISMILYIVLKKLKNNTSKMMHNEKMTLVSLNNEKKILELTLKKKILMSEISKLNKNENP